MADEKYLVFARKWRPQAFEEVVGQEHITRTLQNAIRAGRIGHAFLFVGSRGIGKTTTARILAKALNCLSVDGPTTTPCGTCDNCTSIADGNNMDVIEIDGASNNTVADVREIREHVRLMPSRSRYKVYIIDEVHQLSLPAFNALLKTLEEPPAHAVFILATTEAHKVPATIISRCQRFDFRRVSVDHICELLRRILDKEALRCSDEALQAIARAAEGGVRDAESILDQLVSYCVEEITFQDVFDVLGLVDWRVMHELCDAIVDCDVARLLRIVEDVAAAGKDLAQFVQDILQYFRNLLVCKTGAGNKLLALPDDEIAQMRAHADRFTLMKLIRLVEQFAELTKGFDSQLAQRIALEALLIRLSKRAVEMSVDTVIEKLMQLKEAGAVPAGNSGPTQAAEARPEGRAVGAPVPCGMNADKAASAPRAAKAAPKPARVEVTEHNLASVWPQVVATATERSAGLGVGLGQAAPWGVDGDAVVLRMGPGMDEARALLEKAGNRRALEEALAACTLNLSAFRCEVADDAPTAAEDGEGQEDLPCSGRVNPDKARAALADPHIAKVVDVFKGQIVDVKSEADVAGSE